MPFNEETARNSRTYRHRPEVAPAKFATFVPASLLLLILATPNMLFSRAFCRNGKFRRGSSMRCIFRAAVPIFRPRDRRPPSFPVLQRVVSSSLRDVRDPRLLGAQSSRVQSGLRTRLVHIADVRDVVSGPRTPKFRACPARRGRRPIRETRLIGIPRGAARSRARNIPTETARRVHRRYSSPVSPLPCRWRRATRSCAPLATLSSRPGKLDPDRK